MYWGKKKKKEKKKGGFGRQIRDSTNAEVQIFDQKLFLELLIHIH